MQEHLMAMAAMISFISATHLTKRFFLRLRKKSMKPTGIPDV